MELAIVPLLALLLLHYLGDFVFQTGDMALNKSSSNYYLTLHIATYTGTLAIGGLGLAFFFQLALPAMFLWCVINGVVHWGVDYVTSRISKHYWETKQVDNFWKIIGLDQWVHGTCLLLTYHYFFGA